MGRLVGGSGFDTGTGRSYRASALGYPPLGNVEVIYGDLGVGQIGVGGRGSAYGCAAFVAV